MNFFDWLDIASHLARLILLLVSPVLAGYSLKHCVQGDLHKAAVFIGWAIFLRINA